MLETEWGLDVFAKSVGREKEVEGKKFLYGGRYADSHPSVETVLKIIDMFEIEIAFDSTHTNEEIAVAITNSFNS